MSNYSNYDVAVMNYPLFENKKNLENLQNIIFSNPIIDEFEVPIYIHIPFCDSLCDFCIYNRIYAMENSNVIDQYVNALIKEIKLYSSSEYIKNLNIGSMFIGGGTPTVLNETQMDVLLTTLRESFNIKNCEITVECNPSSATASKVKLLRQLGVTRISTGIQTFDDDLRSKMHIQKDCKYVINWLENAHKYNFNDISIDLMYGFPGTDIDHFLSDIKRAVGIDLGHISIYKLAAFAYTKLYKDVDKGKYKLPESNLVEKMFYQAHEYLINNDFNIQSTQEYGKKDKSVKFWELTYDGFGNNLSFGLASFGYVNGYCYQNEIEIQRYIEKMKSNMLPIKQISSKINEVQLLERTMIIGFRKGFVSKELFYKIYNKHIDDIFKFQIRKQLEEGFIYETKEGYYLTPKGLYYQGIISAEYMISIFENVSPLKKKMSIGTHQMP